MVCFVQPFQSSQFVTAGALRGAGDTKFTATVIFVSTLIVRSAIGYLFVIVFNWGLIGAWFAIVVDQLLKTSMIFYRYQQGKWRFLKLAK